MQEELKAMKIKMVDLEDWASRNNVKSGGISELVSPSELQSYIQQMITTLLPDTTTHEVTVDRARQLPKPPLLPDTVPCNVSLFSHQGQFDAMCMEEFPSLEPLRGHHIIRGPQLVSLTKLLRNHNAPYRWGYPAKLLITLDNKSYAVATASGGLKLPKKWGLVTEEEHYHPVKSPPRRVDKDHLNFLYITLSLWASTFLAFFNKLLYIGACALGFTVKNRRVNTPCTSCVFICSLRRVLCCLVLSLLLFSLLLFVFLFALLQRQMLTTICLFTIPRLAV